MRLTAIGDLHGTLDNLLDIVIYLGYVDKKLDWIEPELHFLLIGGIGKINIIQNLGFGPTLTAHAD